jgi:hypothetical protein
MSSPFAQASRTPLYSGTTPLRRRENDLFAAPQHYLSELPPRRIKRKSDKVAKYVMRGVLLSPVIVLVMWSVVALTWTSKRPHVSREGFLEVAEVLSGALGEAQPAMGQREGKMLPVYGPLGKNQPATIVRPRPQPNRRESLLVVQPAYFPTNNNRNPMMQAQPLRGRAQTQLKQTQPLQPRQMPGYIVMGQQKAQSQPFPFAGAIVPQPVLSESYQDSPLTSESYQQAPLMAESYQQAPLMAESFQQAPLMAESYQQEPLMAESYQQAPLMAESYQQAPLMAESYQQAPLMAESYQQAPLMAESYALPPLVAEPEPPMGGAEPRTVVYYYDPAHVVTNRNGQLVLPNTVYDAQGKAVSLRSLQAKELLIEPPHMTMIHHNTSANATQYNYTYSHPTVVTERYHRQSGATLNKILTVPTSAPDQSIVVATFGVVALLVGALSARKLRARSLLSACIENEALQDEVAFDTAYTQSANSYNTFSWKQDLEKFDV